MATMGLMTFFIILLSVGFIGLLIFLWKKIYGDKERAGNYEIIVNMLFAHTNGYGLLLRKSKEENKEIVKIKGSQRDINYDEIKEDESLVIVEQDLFVRKDLYLNLGNSGHREIKLALPDCKEQLPASMDNDLKIKLGELIDERNAKKDTLEIKNLREENLLKLTIKTEGLEVASELVGLYSEATKDAIKSREPTQVEKK